MPLLIIEVTSSVERLSSQTVGLRADHTINDTVRASDLPKEVQAAVIELNNTKRSTMVESKFIVPIPERPGAWWTVKTSVQP